MNEGRWGLFEKKKRSSWIYQFTVFSSFLKSEWKEPRKWADTWRASLHPQAIAKAVPFFSGINSLLMSWKREVASYMCYCFGLPSKKVNVIIKTVRGEKNVGFMSGVLWNLIVTSRGSSGWKSHRLIKTTLIPSSHPPSKGVNLPPLMWRAFN